MMKTFLKIFALLAVLVLAVIAIKSWSGCPTCEPDDVTPPPAAESRTISLYYYNQAKDTDETGNVMCSVQGLEAVERQIPVTITPIQDAIRLLIRGELTTAERSAGIGTEFPLQGFELTGASLANGVLTLSFSDPQNSTVGGSCRTAIIWSQIRSTALQFDEVSEVQFLPEDLFQP